MKGPNPYVGPRPFEAGDSALFKGRDREARDLHALLVANRAVLFYAQSGAGKTSLINARLLPLLHEDGFDVMPTARVQAAVPDGIDVAGVANIYTFGVLSCWAESARDIRALAQVTLTERFAPPPKGRARPLVLVIDQFEEFFTVSPPEPAQREAFFEQLRAMLDADPMLRVLLVVREDFLAQLEPFAPILPGKLREGLRLERLSRDAALQAIREPLEPTGCRFDASDATDVAELLVDELLKTRVEVGGVATDIQGEFVEPVQLQLVCQRLWERLPEDSTLITREHLVQFGDVDETLLAFYEECIRDALAVGEANEGTLRSWFSDKLITPAGTRGTVYAGLDDAGGLATPVVDVLVERHLVRSEVRAGASWFELTHDRFIGPIVRSNRAWRARYGTALNVIRRLQERANEWRVSGASAFLPGEDLFAARAVLASPEAQQLRYDEEIDRFVSANEAHVEAQRREKDAIELVRAEGQLAKERSRRMVVYAAGMFFIGVLALGLLYSAKDARASAEAARVQEDLRRQADESLRKYKEEAEKAKAEAEKARIAKEEKIRADADKEAANKFAQKQTALRDKEAMARADAEANARTALARELAAAAERVIDRDPELGVVLSQRAVEATMQRDAKVTSEAEAALRRAVASQRLRHTFRRNGQALSSAVFSRDGSAVTALTSSGELLRWRLGTPGTPPADPEVVQLFPTRSWLFSVSQGAAISPDGKWVALSTADQSWLARADGSGKPLLLSGDKAVTSTDFRFSADGTKLAMLNCSGSPGAPDARAAFKCGRIRMWDLRGESPKPTSDLANLEMHSRPAMAFSPTGSALVFSADGSGVQQLAADAAEPKTLVKAEAMDNGGMRSIAFGGDGSIAAYVGRDRQIRLVDGRTFAFRKSIDVQGDFTMLTFNRTSTRLLAASSDGSVRMLDTATGEEVARFLGHRRELRALAFSPDESSVVTTSADGTLRVWDARRVASLEVDAEDTPVARKLEYSASARFVFVARRGGGIVAARDGAKAPIAHVGLQDFAFDPTQESRLATVGRDADVRLWDARTGQRVGVIHTPLDSVALIRFSPDGKRIAVADEESAAIIDLASRAVVKRIDGHQGAISSLAFLGEGRWLATGGEDRTIRLWDLSGRDKSRVLDEHEDTVTWIADGPEGQLVSASDDGKLKVWDIEQGASRMTIELPLGRILGLSTGQDGARIAVTYNSALRVIDIRTGKEIQTLPLGRSMAFNRRGDEIAWLSRDGKRIEFQPFQGIGALMRTARSGVKRTLSSDECQSYRLDVNECRARDVMQRASARAKNGDVEAAESLYRQAMRHDTTLKFDPRMRAREVAAEKHVLAAVFAARRGDIDGAFAEVRIAKGLNSELPVDEEQLVKVSLQVWVDRVRGAGERGNLARAMTFVDRVKTVKAPAATLARLHNSVCWWGTLYLQAAKVSGYCDAAVTYEVASSFLDSRGVNRAARGDLAGARADFVAALAERDQDTSFVKSRTAWIARIDAGENPITEAELAALRGN